jgi:hypothetical protein
MGTKTTLLLTKQGKKGIVAKNYKSLIKNLPGEIPGRNVQSRSIFSEMILTTDLPYPIFFS